MRFRQKLTSIIKIPKWLADTGLWINRVYYKQLFHSVYGSEERSPSWFGHRIDLYYLWPHNLFWLERGIFPRKHMFKGCTVLDLFCGDGFFSRYFYSTIANHIDAVDKDPKAIAHAKRWHSHPTINYIVLDAVKQDLPRSHYDVIVWFEGLEHLNEIEYKAVINKIKTAIARKGVVIGSTPLVPKELVGKGNWEHQNEFTEVKQLISFLERDFHHVQTHVTVYPVFGGGERCSAYFTLKEPK